MLVYYMYDVTREVPCMLFSLSFEPVPHFTAGSPSQKIKALSYKDKENIHVLARRKTRSKHVLAIAIDMLI